MTSFSNVSNASPRSGDSSDPILHTLVVFSPYERKSAIAIGMASLTSCVMVSVLLLYIFISVILSWRQRHSSCNLTIAFIKKEIAVFVICLLLADLIHSISGVLELKWAMENRIYEGVTCTSQAAIITFGTWSSAIWSSVIALHTFSNIALRKEWSRRTVYAVVISGWAVFVSLTVIGPAALETPSNGPFYGINGAWCAITSSYPVKRLGIQHIPWFITAIIIVLSYGLLFLVLRGNISFIRGIRSDEIIPRERVVIARRMLWYPAAFLACISPIMIIRLIGIFNDHIPFEAWTCGVFISQLLGAADSVVYATTRRLIKPVRLSINSSLKQQPNNSNLQKSESDDITPANESLTQNIIHPYILQPGEDYVDQRGGPCSDPGARSNDLSLSTSLGNHEQNLTAEVAPVTIMAASRRR